MGFFSCYFFGVCVGWGYSGVWKKYNVCMMMYLSIWKDIRDKKETNVYNLESTPGHVLCLPRAYLLLYRTGTQYSSFYYLLCSN